MEHRATPARIGERRGRSLGGMETAVSRRWWFLLLCALPGCDLLGDSAVVISESEAAEIVTTRLGAMGYSPTEKGHAISNMEVCDQKTGGCEVVTFSLDGWDAGHRVGFEYLADGDADFASANGASYAFWADSLQDAVKTKLPDDVILIIREVAHETRELAVGQLEDIIDARLAEYGVGK